MEEEREGVDVESDSTHGGQANKAKEKEKGKAAASTSQVTMEHMKKSFKSAASNPKLGESIRPLGVDRVVEKSKSTAQGLNKQAGPSCFFQDITNVSHHVLKKPSNTKTKDAEAQPIPLNEKSTEFEAQPIASQTGISDGPSDNYVYSIPVAEGDFFNKGQPPNVGTETKDSKALDRTSSQSSHFAATVETEDGGEKDMEMDSQSDDASQGSPMEA